MKITVNKIESVEIELPMYFELYGTCYKTLGNGVALIARNCEINKDRVEYPSITTGGISHIGGHVDQIKHISETEFNLAYLGAEHRLNEFRS